MSVDVPRRLRLGALEGVWLWAVALPQDTAQEVVAGIGARLGWHAVSLDTSGAATKEQFLQACSDSFALPSWFGMNWDALDECLADLDVGESEGILVAWMGWNTLRDADPVVFGDAVSVLEDAARRWTQDGVSGAVVLIGEADGLPLRRL